MLWLSLSTQVHFIWVFIVCKRWQLVRLPKILVGTRGPSQIKMACQGPGGGEYIFSSGPATTAHPPPPPKKKKSGISSTLKNILDILATPKNIPHSVH